jgi:anaerobic selenocysteine-containing dehydrogenase
MTIVDGPRTVHSFCRICQASCGLLIDVDGDQILKVSGDPDHALSRGYTCSKGRSLGRMHHDPNRLEEPSLHGEQVGWDAVMADLAEGLRTILDEHGPDSIACYRSTGWILDSAGRTVADRWMRAVGTQQLYSPNTIDTPNRMLVPDLITGSAFLQSNADWERVELLVIVGHNIVVSHGHVTSVADPLSRLREVKARGGKVLVVDPRRTETAQQADLHLQPAAGTDAALMACFVRHRLTVRCDHDYLSACAVPSSVDALRRAVDPFDPATTAARCRLDPAELDPALELLGAVDRLVYASGTGVSMGPTPNATEWLGWALGAVTGSLDREGGMLFSAGVLRPQDESGPMAMPRVSGPAPVSRPDVEHFYGEYPAATLCDEILSGRIKALISYGGNIAASFPNSEKTREALASLEVLAVTELHPTLTTEMATHVLPTCDQLERHDLTFFLDRAFVLPFAQYTAPVVAPAGNRRPLWRVMAELGERMGLDMPGSVRADDEEQLVAAQAKRSRVPFAELQAAKSGVVAEGVPLWDWLIPHKLPNGRLDLAPAVLVAELRAWAEASAADAAEPGLRLICRRLPHQMNSDLQDLESQQRSPFPTLLMHPDDAGAAGLDDGATVTVANANGTTQALLEVTDRIRTGVVSIPHAWRTPAVNQLTSTDDLEPITGMPRYTGIPVTVTREP